MAMIGNLIRQFKNYYKNLNLDFPIDYRYIKKSMKHYSKSQLIEIIYKLCQSKEIRQKLISLKDKYGLHD